MRSLAAMEVHRRVRRLCCTVDWEDLRRPDVTVRAPGRRPVGQGWPRSAASEPNLDFGGGGAGATCARGTVSFSCVGRPATCWCRSCRPRSSARRGRAKASAPPRAPTDRDNRMRRRSKQHSLCPMSAQDRGPRKFLEGRPTFAHIGQLWSILGDLWPEAGRARPNSCAQSAQSGERLSTQLGHSLARKPPSSGRCLPISGTAMRPAPQIHPAMQP